MFTYNLYIGTQFVGQVKARNIADLFNKLPRSLTWGTLLRAEVV